MKESVKLFPNGYCAEFRRAVCALLNETQQNECAEMGHVPQKYNDALLRDPLQSPKVMLDGCNVGQAWKTNCSSHRGGTL
jgi:hypothetical protein